MAFSKGFRAAALLLVSSSLVVAAPLTNATAPHTFSTDKQNFLQTTQLLHNLHTRVGVPFSAINKQFDSHLILDMDPLELSLVPRGYPQTPGNREEKIVIDEQQIITVCTELDNAGVEVKSLCPAQADDLRLFFGELRDHGNRVATPSNFVKNGTLMTLPKTYSLFNGTVANSTVVGSGRQPSNTSTLLGSSPTAVAPTSTAKSQTNTSSPATMAAALPSINGTATVTLSPVITAPPSTPELVHYECVEAYRNFKNKKHFSTDYSMLRYCQTWGYPPLGGIPVN